MVLSNVKSQRAGQRTAGSFMNTVDSLRFLKYPELVMLLVLIFLFQRIQTNGSLIPNHLKKWNQRFFDSEKVRELELTVL
jgi:hypothetical protein